MLSVIRVAFVFQCEAFPGGCGEIVSSLLAPVLFCFFRHRDDFGFLFGCQLRQSSQFTGFSSRRVVANVAHRSCFAGQSAEHRSVGTVERPELHKQRLWNSRPRLRTGGGDVCENRRMNVVEASRNPDRKLQYRAEQLRRNFSQSGEQFRWDRSQRSHSRIVKLAQRRHCPGIEAGQRAERRRGKHVKRRHQIRWQLIECCRQMDRHFLNRLTSRSKNGRQL